MPAKRAAKPKPVPVTTVCDLCGLAWALHGSDPTTDDCIRLLKVEAAKKIQPIFPYVPHPYIERPFKEVPWRSPFIWESKTGCGEGAVSKVVINKTITS